MYGGFYFLFSLDDYAFFPSQSCTKQSILKTKSNGYKRDDIHLKWNFSILIDAERELRQKIIIKSYGYKKSKAI